MWQSYVFNWQINFVTSIFWITSMFFFIKGLAFSFILHFYSDMSGKEPTPSETETKTTSTAHLSPTDAVTTLRNTVPGSPEERQALRELREGPFISEETQRMVREYLISTRIRLREHMRIHFRRTAVPEDDAEVVLTRTVAGPEVRVISEHVPEAPKPRRSARIQSQHTRGVRRKLTFDSDDEEEDANDPDYDPKSDKITMCIRM